MTLKGITLILMSSFLFSGCSVIAKLIDIPSSQIVFIRSATIFSMMMILNTRFNCVGDKDVRGLLILRGILGSCCSLLYFYAIQRMELADVVVIFLNTSSVACFLSFLSGSPLSTLSVISWVFMLLGCLFMFRPDSIFHLNNAAERFECLIACYVAILFGGMAICIVKRLVQKVHYTCLITWSTMSSTILSFVTIYISDSNLEVPDKKNCILLALLIFVSLAAQMLLNKGIKHVNVITGSFVSNFDIIISYLCSIFLFHESLDWTSNMGAFLTLVSAFAVAIDNYKYCPKNSEQNEENQPLLKSTSTMIEEE